MKKVHIADTELTLENWHKHVNWLNVVLIVGVPLMGCVATAWVPLQFKTAVWAVVYYFFTGLGITAGMSPEWPRKKGFL
jgi:stearoyl-CoA desaturase (Delta-9 desaturase)